MVVASKLAKHSVMVAIDYWLAAWTSSSPNKNKDFINLDANATNYTENTNAVQSAGVEVTSMNKVFGYYKENVTK